MDLRFLKSRRFWLMVAGVIVLYLHKKEIIEADELWAIETFIGGFISVRTIDRFGEKSGQVIKEKLDKINIKNYTK